MTTAAKIKISLNGDVQELVPPKTLPELYTKLHALYKDKLPATYKLCYIDNVGDKLTITNSADYELALSYIHEIAKFTIEPAGGDSPKKLSDEFEFIDSPSLLQPEDPKEKKQEAPDIVPVSSVAALESKEEEKVDPTTDIYACMYCNGTKVNKKGTPCKKCKGTGKMTKALVNRVRNIVKSELDKMLKTEVQQYASQLVKSQNFSAISQIIAPSATVHPGVICDKCGMTPIKGVRYKCATCEDFDLCENCERTFGHEHAMLKIRSPSQKPAAIFTAAKGSPPVYRVGHEEEKTVYSAGLIGENLKGADNKIEAGTESVKVWTFKNTGKIAWPKETILAPSEGSGLAVSATKVGELRPGETVEIKTSFKTPATPGRYVCFYQLSDGKGTKFGDRVSLDIVVVEPKESALKLDPNLVNPKKKVEEEVRTKIIAKLSNIPKIPTKYMDNLVELVQIYSDYDPEVLLEMLKQKNNNIQEVCDFILSISHNK